MLSLASSSVAAKAVTVLVIEDDDELAAALCQLLAFQGYEPVRREDSLAAIEWLQSGRLPAVILLDLMTPRMDGWEFRVAQRRRSAWSAIPVIALSADRSAKAAAIDADAFLPKPLDERLLLATIARVLTPRSEPRAQPVTPPAQFVFDTIGAARQQCRALAAELTGAPAARTDVLGRLLEQAHRGAHAVVSELEACSPFGEQRDRSGTVDVTRVLEQSLELIAPELPASTRVTRGVARLPRANGCPLKLGAALLSLLRNAAEALKRTPAPRLHVQAWLEAGEQVMISVSDNGAGIAARDEPHVFEPFFTTKLGVTSAGLGLPSALSQVREMGGRLHFETSEGHGSTFVISLQRELEAGPLLARASAEKPRLLVVEEELSSLLALSESLASDFQVVSLLRPSDALTHLEAGSRYDLVLANLDMQEMAAMVFYTTLSLELPEQAGRVLFLRGERTPRYALEVLDALAVCHLDRGLAPARLRAQLAKLVQLWSALGVSHPSPPTRA